MPKWMLETWNWKKKVKNESNPSSGKLASAAAAGGDLSTKKPESTAGATAIGGWSRCSSAASPCHWFSGVQLHLEPVPPPFIDCQPKLGSRSRCLRTQSSHIDCKSVVQWWINQKIDSWENRWMFKCIHGWTCKLLVSPVVGNLPKILSAGGGWGRINPPPVAPPYPLSRPPLLDVHPHWASSSATPPISRPISQFSDLTCWAIPH